MAKKISIIVPCYNEEETVRTFYNEVRKVVASLDYYFEIVYVNDGSRDQTVNEVLKLREEDKSVTLIDFSRNFGKESAILAGLEYSKEADAAVVKDLIIFRLVEKIEMENHLFEASLQMLFIKLLMLLVM